MDQERQESLIQKHSRQLNTLNEISTRMHGLVNSENIYKEILRIVQEHFHFYHVSFWAVNKEQNEAKLEASDGAYSHVLQPGFILKDKGVVIHCINIKKPYLCNDTTKDSNFTTLELPTETRSSLSVPVISQDSEVRAVINMESIFHGAFEKDDLNVMESVASLIALALNYTTLYNEVKKFNFHLKDIVKSKTSKLREAHERILSQQKLLEKENYALKTIVSKGYNSKEIIGNSNPTKFIISMIEKIASTKIPVLIQGETGTGKELIANKIHWKSDRFNKPFIVLNCASLKKSNVKEELLGMKEINSEEGSKKIPLLESADEGTLFLEDITALNMEAQTELLRFLQEENIFSSKNNQIRKVNIRIISSTHKDLEQEMKKGNFREDLFYRLNTITLRVSPLRERVEDIPLLVNHFMAKCKFGDQQELKIEPQALNAIINYHWPGNVRELQNTIESIKMVTEGGTVHFDNLPFNIKMAQKTLKENTNCNTATSSSKSMTLMELEKSHIIQMLSHQKGNKTKTAKTLGITIKTLYNKLHRYKLIQKAVDQVPLERH